MNNLDNNLILNKVIESNAIIDQLHTSFKTRTDFKDDSIVLINSPFQTIEINNFLSDENDLLQLVEELNNLDFCNRNNDLYSFKQSEDLNNSKEVYISKFRNMLQFHFKNWLHKVTEIELNEEVNLTCSKYIENDVLLCHDDELESRRIAFTFYLTPDNWQQKNGGLLRLFDRNEKGEPFHVTREIHPSRNKIVCFEVSEDSYHEVSEVLCGGVSRLSLHGWFHSAPVPRKPRATDPICVYLNPVHVELELVYEWINPTYLEPISQDNIQNQFEKQSEIQLPNFFKDNKYNEILNILNNNKMAWDDKGPANKRRYQVLTDLENEQIQNLVSLLGSEVMMLLLSNLTGLSLHSLFKQKDEDDDDDDDETSRKRPKTEDSPTNINSKYIYEIRKWNHGCYKLMYDSPQTTKNEFTLDVFMYFTSEDIDYDMGGHTSYITTSDGEQLLNIEPNHNCLNLVYCEKDTNKFVKYINNKINQLSNNQFFDVHFSYFESE